jgi:hypothetical protein
MPLGGYSVNGNASYIQSDIFIKIESKLVELYNTVYFWISENWRLLSISMAVVLMVISIFLMIIAYCNDQRRKRAKESKKYLSKIASNIKQNNHSNNYNDLEPSAPLLQTDIEYISNSNVKTKDRLLSPCNIYKVEGLI